MFRFAFAAPLTKNRKKMSADELKKMLGMPSATAPSAPMSPGQSLLGMLQGGGTGSAPPSPAPAPPAPHSSCPSLALAPGDDTLPDPVPPHQLHCTALTKIPTAYSYKSGRSIAANRNFICYVVKNALIRVLYRHATTRALLKAHKAKISDVAFLAAPAAKVGAADRMVSVDADGLLVVWELPVPAADASEVDSRVLFELQLPGGGGAVGVQPCPGGKLAVIGGGADGGDLAKSWWVSVVDVATQRSTSAALADEPLVCAVTPGALSLAVGLASGRVQFFNLLGDATAAATDDDGQGPALVHEFVAHDGQPVNHVSFVAPGQPGGGLICVTGAAGNSELAVWRAGGNGLPASQAAAFQCVQRLRPGPSALGSASAHVLRHAGPLYFWSSTTQPHAVLLRMAAASGRFDRVLGVSLREPVLSASLVPVTGPAEVRAARSAASPKTGTAVDALDAADALVAAACGLPPADRPSETGLFHLFCVHPRSVQYFTVFPSLVAEAPAGRAAGTSLPFDPAIMAASSAAGPLSSPSTPVKPLSAGNAAEERVQRAMQLMAEQEDEERVAAQAQQRRAAEQRARQEAAETLRKRQEQQAQARLEKEKEAAAAAAKAAAKAKAKASKAKAKRAAASEAADGAAAHDDSNGESAAAPADQDDEEARSASPPPPAIDVRSSTRVEDARVLIDLRHEPSIATEQDKAAEAARQDQEQRRRIKRGESTVLTDAHRLIAMRESSDSQQPASPATDDDGADGDDDQAAATSEPDDEDSGEDKGVSDSGAGDVVGAGKKDDSKRHRRKKKIKKTGPAESESPPRPASPSPPAGDGHAAAEPGVSLPADARSLEALFDRKFGDMMARFDQSLAALAAQQDKHLREQARALQTTARKSGELTHQAVQTALSRALDPGVLRAALKESLVESVGPAAADAASVAFRQQFSEALVPGFERAAQEMARQISASLVEGVAVALAGVRGQLAETVAQAATAAAAGAPSGADGALAGLSPPPPSTRDRVARLLAEESYEDAFTTVLTDKSDPGLLIWVCGQVDAALVLNTDQPLVSNVLVLTLIQQLVVGNGEPGAVAPVHLGDVSQRDLALHWLNAGLLVLRTEDPDVRSHTGPVLMSVVNTLKPMVGLPGVPKQAKLTLFIAEGLANQAKN